MVDIFEVRVHVSYITNPTLPHPINFIYLPFHPIHPKGTSSKTETIFQLESLCKNDLLNISDLLRNFDGMGVAPSWFLC